MASRIKMTGRWLLFAFVLLSGCGKGGLPTGEDDPGSVDEVKTFFLQYSSPIDPYDFTATISFSVYGQGLARGTVTTPAGEQIYLPGNDAADLVTTTVGGTIDVLSDRFTDGDYEFTIIFRNGFSRFITRSVSGLFPSFPVVVSPLDEGQITLTPTIEWFRAPQVDEYEVVVFLLPCDCEVFGMTVGGDASYMLLTVPEGNLEPDTSYRIEVRALSLEGVKASATVLHVSTE